MAARLELTIRRGVTLFQSDHIWSSDRRLTGRNWVNGQIRSLLAQSKSPPLRPATCLDIAS
jgi:hypothetical protein